jgi:NAD(P)H-dependent FMN reductase
VCGSLYARSSNRSLLDTVASAASEDVEPVFFEGLSELPFFDPDREASGVPAVVQTWRSTLRPSTRC